MLCKVTHCAGRVSANTRPHQLRWGDREMGTAIISCVECSQVAGLIQKVGRQRAKLCLIRFIGIIRINEIRVRRVKNFRGKAKTRVRAKFS